MTRRFACIAVLIAPDRGDERNKGERETMELENLFPLVSWLRDSLGPGVIGALLGSVVTALVTVRLDRIHWERESAKEHRRFQRDVIMEIQDKLWSVTMSASSIHMHWNAAQRYARERRTDEYRNEIDQGKAEIELLKALIHRLEVLESRIDDDTFREHVKDILDIGANMGPMSIDEPQGSIEQLHGEFRSRYTTFRELARTQLRSLVR